MHLFLRVGEDYPPEEAQRRLVHMLYERNDYSFHRGTFRVRGDVLEIVPAHEEDQALRIEFFGDTVEAISVIDPLTGAALSALEECTVFPGSHFVTGRDRLVEAMRSIRAELAQRLRELEAENRLVATSAPGTTHPL